MVVDLVLIGILVQYQINNHVWGSSSKRDADFVSLVYEMTRLKVNLKIADNIAKKRSPTEAEEVEHQNP